MKALRLPVNTRRLEQDIVLRLLKQLREVKVEYPPQLLDETRANYTTQVEKKIYPTGMGQIRS